MSFLLAPDQLRRTVDTPDGPAHWVELGSGPPLVMVQAWGPQPGVTSWLVYRAVAEILAAEYRCLLVDLPNYGLTGPVEYHEPAHDVAARAVVAILDHLGIESAPVVGTSMGATTALDLAIAHPSRVSALVVGACHASTGGDPYLLGPFPSEVSRLYAEHMAEPRSRDRLNRLMRGLVFDENLVTAELLDELAAFSAEHEDHRKAHEASVSVPHSNLAALSSIDVPLRVIHGRFDRMVPYEQGLMIASYVTQSDAVILGRCGHWPPFERPADFAREVAVFLSTLEVSDE